MPSCYGKLRVSMCRPARNWNHSGIAGRQAWQDVREFRLVWAAVLPSWEVMEHAQGLLERYSLSYWDAMIVAARRKLASLGFIRKTFPGATELMASK